MKATHRMGYLVTLCAVALFGVAETAQAIPEFARKYHTTCARCHIGFPKLTTFGKNFRMSGYQQPGDSKTKKIYADEDPNFSLPSSIPFAIQLKSSMSFPEWVNASDRNSFDFFNEAELLAGGTLAPNMGFFSEISVEDGEAAVKKANAVFSFLGGQNVFLQVGLLDLMENGLSNEFSLTDAPYSIYDVNVGGFALDHIVGGIRLFGTVGSTITSDLVKGNPSSGDDGASGDSQNKLVPVNGFAGGQDLQLGDQGDPYDSMKGMIWEVAISDGSTEGQSDDPNAPITSSPGVTDYWARVGFNFDNDSQLGLFGYSGRTIVQDPNTLAEFENKFHFYGADLTWQFGKPIKKAGNNQKPYIFEAAAVTGRADNPTAVVNSTPMDVSGYFAQLGFITGPNDIVTARYDRVNSGDNPDWQHESYTFNYTHFLRTNFAIAGEYTRDVNGDDSLGVFFRFAF
ncbi:MAG TPA: hypothetical protein VNI20_09045 [Fimbriimonadaceae bacterium]|nr:hypothetical protein [Fimbriimonadaceae bacterium]